MRPVALVALLSAVAFSACAQAPAPSAPSAPPKTAAAAPKPAPAPQAASAPAPSSSTGDFAIVLKDGTRIAAVEPPIIAMGRVLYKTADGARHAVPQEQVNLDATHPAAPPAPQRVAQGQVPGLPAPPPASARREAPDFTAKKLDGTEVKLSSLRGKVVLVDFWATWCGPCMMEMPNVKKVYDAHAGKDFEIVGVSLDRSRVEMEAYLRSSKIEWPQYFDAKGWENAVARQYGVSSIPTALLLDRQGRVARVGARGPMLEPAIVDLIAEK